jgi:hypothetical protein
MRHDAAHKGGAMLFPFDSMMLLALESSSVIGLRLLRLASGGRDAADEAHLMVNEKINAALEAGATLINGGGAAAVIDRYRVHVAANAGRLARGTPGAR